MTYDLIEPVNDILVAYLKSKVSGDMAVFPGGSAEKIQYPCVITMVTQADGFPGASWQDACKMRAEIQTLTQAADEIDANGVVVRTARAIHAAARSSVLTALTVKDSEATPAGLLTLFDATDMPKGLAARLCLHCQGKGAIIQGAQPGSPLAQMSVDEQHGCLVTLTMLDMVAMAVEI